jgi:excisionase family DNA binding protein
MTGPNPTAATPTRRGRTPQAVPAPRQTAHRASPSPSAAAATGPDRPAISARPTSEPLLLTVGQAAHRLGISRSLLYELLAAGDIESITIGRLRRIPTEALTTYIEHQRAKNQDRHRT